MKILYFYRAGLRPIIQMVTKKKNETAALVQKFSDLKLFKDLKNRKACFSGYRDIGRKENQKLKN